MNKQQQSLKDILTPEAVRKINRRRGRAEIRFKLFGILAICVSLGLLFVLLTSIGISGIGAFQQTYIKLDVYLDPETIDQDNLRGSNFQGLVKNSLQKLFPEVTSRADKRSLFSLVSSGASFELFKMVDADPALVGQTITRWFPADDDLDMLMKSQIDVNSPSGERRLNDQQLVFAQELQAQGLVKKRFNTTLFTAGDSREPELAGILGALKGSFYALLVTLAISFPIGVAAAIYLEEFAPSNTLTDILEVNINNLAAVPSIVFGLLGLAVFLNVFGLPRSAPLVGGLVLSLMTLPTIIIASRAAIKAVPPSIREAALGIGSSKMQSTLFHVLPLAMPGILTGSIIGMAQALGETAPLLMIGMVAFIVEVPQGFFDPATVLPVQIYLWSDSPERAFLERTAAAILILLAFLIAMNGVAIYLRKKFERQW
jgi:phosphate transport system permease protein